MGQGNYTKYPITSVIIYNFVTVLHFVLCGTGLVLGYPSWIGILLASVYLLFAFAEMYVLMPLKVCPNCPYYKLDDSLCVSGLNVLAKHFAKEGNIKNFSNRAGGLFCANNLHLAGKITFWLFNGHIHWRHYNIRFNL